MLWVKLYTCSLTKDNSERQFFSQFLDPGINETPEVITNVNEQYLFQVFFKSRSTTHSQAVSTSLIVDWNMVSRLGKPSTETSTPLIHKDLDFFTGYMIVTTYAFPQWKWTALLCFIGKNPSPSAAGLGNFNTSRIKKEIKCGTHKHTNHPLCFSVQVYTAIVRRHDWGCDLFPRTKII